MSKSRPTNHVSFLKIIFSHTIDLFYRFKMYLRCIFSTYKENWIVLKIQLPGTKLPISNVMKLLERTFENVSRKIFCIEKCQISKKFWMFELINVFSSFLEKRDCIAQNWPPDIFANLRRKNIAIDFFCACGPEFISPWLVYQNFFCTSFSIALSREE